MLKKKNVIIGGAALLGVVVLVGAGFALGHMHKSPVIQASFANSTADDPSAANSAVGQVNGSTIPLNQAPKATPQKSGLSVASGSSVNSLGQISPSGGGSSSSNGGTSSGSSGAGSNAATVDPTTFSQYEKYKDGSGALFGDVQVGTGAELGASQKAAVYYKGWLTNGTLFDETKNGSDGKMQPFVFQMGAHQVITGWEEGLAGMKIGGTRLIIVPPAVGYGAQAQGSIPANSTLVFEVQLLAAQ